MSLWPHVGEKLVEMGQEPVVQASTCPCTGCRACPGTVPGEMGLHPDVPAARKISEDAFEIPAEEW